MKITTCITTTILATALHASAAGTIITPTITTFRGGVAADAPQAGSVAFLTDSSGLSSALNHGDAVPGTLPTHDGGLSYGVNAARWFNFDLLNAWVPEEFVFDLGQVYDQVGDILFWNYSEQAPAEDRGISSVTASFSDDGVTYSGATTLNFTQASLIDNPFAGETISMSQTSIRYVKFTDITSPAHGGLMGFSEIRFTAVPEPSSAALLGLGGIALILRRRK